jgi:hypothetical protein
VLVLWNLDLLEGNFSVSNAKKMKRNGKTIYELNRQMRENRRKETRKGKANDDAGKIRILSSNAHKSFAHPQSEIDLRSKSKCGIWSVNNCQNNWKSRSRRKREKLASFQAGELTNHAARSPGSIASLRNQYLIFVANCRLRNDV